MVELLTTLVKGLVDNEDAVKVERVEEETATLLKVVVDNADIGRVIGKEGRIANALSTIINSVAHKEADHKKYIIKINEGQR